MTWSITSLAAVRTIQVSGTASVNAVLLHCLQRLWEAFSLLCVSAGSNTEERISSNLACTQSTFTLILIVRNTGVSYGFAQTLSSFDLLNHFRLRSYLRFGPKIISIQFASFCILPRFNLCNFLAYFTGLQAVYLPGYFLL